MKMKLLLAAAMVALAPAAQAETLMDVYKHLHANPELSSMETETAAYLVKRMEKLGFDVTENFGGLGAADPEEVKAAKKAGRSMPSLHSPFFKPDAAAAIPVGVDTMTATAVSLFNE